MENSLKVEMPQLYNPYDQSEILCELETLAMCAFFLAGDDQMGLRDIVEGQDESNIKEYDPKDTYMKSYDELIELIGGYNFYINENNLPEPLIELTIDEGKTALLKDGSKYPIYKVVICGGLE